MLQGRRVLLVISGGIAAYKSLDLIRRLREQGVTVRAALTAAARELVSPLAVATLSENLVHTELFSLTDESEIGHIRLVRDADLVVVAPATANLLAKMATGIADDLASTLLLAADVPVLVAPAMNVVMWRHPATQANLATLHRRGVASVGPAAGEMACGETGEGRMAEVAEIVAAVRRLLGGDRLVGIRALVTSGPTWEAVDAVRFLANRSSGKQGHAIARALARAGATTTLVSGPVALPDPPRVEVVRVESARDMLAACRAALPVEVAVCAAAVADWRVKKPAAGKIKKGAGGPPRLELVENPDILATLAAAGAERPRLVVGFAAETDELAANAVAKRTQKGCDWIVANDVSAASGTFGGERNTVTLVTAGGSDRWPELAKDEVAARLVERIAEQLAR